MFSKEFETIVLNYPYDREKISLFILHQRVLEMASHKQKHARTTSVIFKLFLFNNGLFQDLPIKYIKRKSAKFATNHR